jgi:hypothetical protein
MIIIEKALSANQTAKYESVPNKQDYYNNLMHQRQVNTIKKKMADTRNDKTLTLQEKQQKHHDANAKNSKIYKNKFPDILLWIYNKIQKNIYRR